MNVVGSGERSENSVMKLSVEKILEKTALTTIALLLIPMRAIFFQKQ